VNGPASPKPVLRILTGCTAVGKTEWALRWAEANGGEIVSCDSLLFYRGMDLGTAKPGPAEQGRVPHHLIDILEVTDPMNVARYAEWAKRAIADIAARGRAALVVGGSGFYLRAFFSAVADRWSAPPEIRSRVAMMFERDGLAAVSAELMRLNPQGFGAVDPANPRRVIRALERCLASGRTVAELAAEFARAPAPFAGWRIDLVRLDRSGPDLDARIGARVTAMLEGGLVDEVRGLLAAGLLRNPSAARAIGYREVIAMLDGGLSESELAAAIVKDTRRLVKKQRTWFRTQLPPHRVLQAGDLKSERELFHSGRFT